jgi:DNA repair protein RecO (recombination protein O)
MNQIVTKGIVLSRTDYGEADRILTLLTPDQGKLRLMAKGVRRIKSKLAGGIELFSVTNITFVRGRGDIGTLVSTRLLHYYSHIVEDIDRTMLGYECIKQLNKATEDQPEPVYFELLEEAFAALDDPQLSLELVQVWFGAQLVRLSGHTPDLQTDSAGNKLDATGSYNFAFEDTSLTPHPEGALKVDEIKFLRLLFGAHTPRQLAQVSGSSELATRTRQLVQFMVQQYIQ